MACVAGAVCVWLYRSIPDEIPGDWADVRSLDAAREAQRTRMPRRNATTAPISRTVKLARLRTVQAHHRT